MTNTDASGNTQTDVSGNTQTSSVVKDTTIKFDFNKSMEETFNKSNIVLLIWFLAIYFILYFLINLFTSPSNSDTQASGNAGVGYTVDIIFFLIIILYLGSLFMSSTEKENQNTVEKLGSGLKTYMEDPYSIFSLFLFIFVFYLVIYIVGISMGAKTKPISIWLFENILIFLFVVLLICDFFKYVLKVDLVKIVSDLISNWWSNTENTVATVKNDISNNAVTTGTSPDTSKKTTSGCEKTNAGKIPGGEVFNISNNLYTYDDAQSICKAYGARLADYDDIEESYNQGGEWCNYGWSANQMAFFPTQKATWEKLQGTPEHKNDCGRPGVNGGYFANPDIRFGVNCYGKKPKPSKTELSMMEYNKQHQFAKTPQENAVDEKVKYWKDNAATLLNLNAFNNGQWYREPTVPL
jgi:hypothetical protein